MSINDQVISQRENIKTLKDLKKSYYTPLRIKDELRQNLISHLSGKKKVFKGILGYGKTVIPDLERALLSKHNIIFLGLRGQAKSRMARLMIDLLDDYIPVVDGSDLNDDPLNPISREAIDLITEHGDETPVRWMSREERYSEKLATPDVSIADLIGDVDPIKAASLKLPYSDERVIHFGLVPRSNRGIFVINELPDLQSRIQVSLFNILQEGDIQIRGFKLRLLLDIQFVFTANPEDYTNRGSIVTPLKDRIESQILTHYPKTIDVSKQITLQEARIEEDQLKKIEINPLAEELIERIAFEARDSEYVDEKSGVSARLTISAYENLVSAIERRALVYNEKTAYSRIADFNGVVPAITGKIELVYEGEEEGTANVARILVGKAIRALFKEKFPEPKKVKQGQSNPYNKIIQWFGKGNMVDIFNDMSSKDYKKSLEEVDGLSDLVERYIEGLDENEKLFMMEFALHGLVEYSVLSKHRIDEGETFRDLLIGMIDMDEEFGDEEV